MAELPKPSVVPVDTESTVRCTDVHPNYTTRTESAEVLAPADAALV